MNGGQAKRPGLFSVVFPAYNEERGIESAIRAAMEYLSPVVERFEVVVADDGSTDGTRAKVEALAAEDARIRLVGEGVNRGKGAAVRTGVLASRGDIVLYLDVDLSTPMATLERAWPELDRGMQFVVGSRRMAESDIQVHQPPLREALGDAFRRTVLWGFGLPVSDITCGFKVFDGPLGRKLFERVHLADWSFDAEVLVAAQQGGLRMVDIPVVWRNDPSTKVRLHRDLPLTMLGIASVLLGRMLGRYRAPLEV